MKKLALTLRKGETVAIPLRIESPTLTYKSITAITKAGPVSITVTGHGIKDGWKAAVMNAGGMRQINAESNPPADAEFHKTTVVDANIVQFNDVNSAGYGAYTSGGQLVYYAPLDLSAYASARMTVKDRVGGTQILSFTTENGRLEIDSATDTLWVRMTATDSAAIAVSKGVFDIELVTPSGEVTALCSAESAMTFLPEVTT
jgi:hypothetical protein